MSSTTIPKATTAQQAAGPKKLMAVKAVHMLAWFSIESCVLYVLYAGLRGRSDRRAAVAAAVVAGEVLIFTANGLRCPLTDFAERLGAERGSVTDIYLPRWLARNLPVIHVPLVILAVFLHRKNIAARAGSASRHRPGPRPRLGRTRRLQ
jgi:hypothetical protein